MDQAKIGQYIAEKRRELGMTQADLGAELGVGDKAVSKWERGKSMPDVSAFPQLCKTLGISVNELFAGEDIPTEEIAHKSEENIIGIIRKNAENIKWSKGIIVALTIMLVGLAVFMIVKANQNGEFMSSYIDTFDKDSTENTFANLFNDKNYAVNPIVISDEFDEITISTNVIKNGKIVEQVDSFTHPNDDKKREWKGTAGFCYDSEHNEITLALSGSGSTCNVTRDLDEYIGNVSERKSGFTTIGPECRTRRTELKKGEPKALFAISFDEDGYCSGGNFGSYLNEPSTLKNNDWVFVYAVEYR